MSGKRRRLVRVTSRLAGVATSCRPLRTSLVPSYPVAKIAFRCRSRFPVPLAPPCAATRSRRVLLALPSVVLWSGAARSGDAKALRDPRAKSAARDRGHAWEMTYGDGGIRAGGVVERLSQFRTEKSSDLIAVERSCGCVAAGCVLISTALRSECGRPRARRTDRAQRLPEKARGGDVICL